MDPRVPAGLSRAEARKFGLQVGGAFLVLSALLWWKGKLGAVPYVAGLGGALFLTGVIKPTALGPIYRAWMGLAHLMSKITTPIFMSVVYFLVLTPAGLLLRTVGKHPLRHRPRPDSHWYSRESETVDPARMERQF